MSASAIVVGPLTPPVSRLRNHHHHQWCRSNSDNDLDAHTCFVEREKRYTIGRKLSKGAFSIVYKGTDTETKDAVAIKVLTSTIDHRIFVRESSVMMGLRHANIVRLLDVYDNEKMHFVFEYVGGGDLFEWLEAKYKKKLPLRMNPIVCARTAIDITRQIGVAIAYIHAKGIAHRDLKPENVLVGRGEPNILVKVTDFGLCFVAPKDDTQGPRTRDAVGSQMYVPPEIVFRRRNDTFDPFKGDVWAYGIILFAVTHNYFPWRPDKQLVDPKSRPPANLDNVKEHVCAPVCRVIEEALCEDPEERPVIKDLVADERFVDMEGIDLDYAWDPALPPYPYTNGDSNSSSDDSTISDSVGSTPYGSVVIHHFGPSISSSSDDSWNEGVPSVKSE